MYSCAESPFVGTGVWRCKVTTGRTCHVLFAPPIGGVVLMWQRSADQSSGLPISPMVRRPVRRWPIGRDHGWSSGSRTRQSRMGEQGELRNQNNKFHFLDQEVGRRRNAAVGYLTHWPRTAGPVRGPPDWPADRRMVCADRDHACAQERNGTTFW